MLNAQRVFYEKQINQVFAVKTAEQRIVRYFPDTHLGNGHTGLATTAEEQGVDVKKLSKGEYVIFVNKAKTGLKMFAPGNVVAYLKMPGNSKLDLRIISMVPRFFNGQKINYDAALEQRLRKDFKVPETL